MEMHRLVMRLWADHRPGVLLVTHDVDEALLLADRVAVLVDGHLAFQVEIDLARPRNRNHRHLTALHAELLHAVGVNDGQPNQEGAA
jgi:sulfonate transport system ATP-binding protein